MQTDRCGYSAYELADRKGGGSGYTKDGYPPPPPPVKKGYVPPPPPPKQPPSKKK